MKFTVLTATVSALCFLGSLARASVPVGKDITDLPEGLEGVEGKLSLLLDQKRKGEDGGSVAVYLINRTGKDISLNAQDFDIYMKLEVQEADGSWKRAQPHACATCGNSYFPLTLKDGHFFERAGFQPMVDARKARVRFRIYQQDFELFTKPFDGLVSDAMIDKASQDVMAVRTGDFEFVSKVALGEIKLNNTVDHVRDMQGLAISTLVHERFDLDKSIEVLNRISEKFPGKKEQVDSMKAHIASRKSVEK